MPASEHNESSSHDEPTLPTAVNDNDAEISDDEVLWDVMRSRVDEEEEMPYRGIGTESEVEEDLEAEHLWEDEDLEECLLELSIKDDDPGGGGWFPRCSRKKRRKAGQ